MKKKIYGTGKHKEMMKLPILLIFLLNYYPHIKVSFGSILAKFLTILGRIWVDFQYNFASFLSQLRVDDF